jgi:hypothetical protein
LNSFLEVNFFKLLKRKGMLPSLEDVLFCEQKVSAGEIAILKAVVE